MLPGSAAADRGKGASVADRRNYRKWTAGQKLEIVLAGIKSANIEQTCRDHEISSTRYYRWRDQSLLVLGSRVWPGRLAELAEQLHSLPSLPWGQGMDRGLGTRVGLGFAYRSVSTT